ncbi:hypothetical protein NIES2135_61320 (plasmid) [Leptolyngbya boryana NIES-2135]|jgi:hypothetical protein|uniref:Uncharacterized protein n=1 Tax=Leptolyngbya boryana NIES-2135 TaxID=1973484 RepID=A0A1Z4JR60_LEPBY|nr:MULTISPECIES: hypothetical protein [Leptolyngbya]BAY59255.1 hypothetical protein NIES2135_61320 [Leptolyngbya boryana NIES-2135]MBD2372844.1 hypothetical protein [Leptolyngbya sp. FACHB-238]MBD2397403.1 hypothetical protein [Leptolyngbya sp. FACHB-239]MBD2403792.1 hypothetical protein [Leptolyngbya sp. FACHB-402]ULP33448.1 hypothetical protein MCP04_30430 [Leptolyngbya boryana IU 594]
MTDSQSLNPKQTGIAYVTREFVRADAGANGAQFSDEDCDCIIAEVQRLYAEGNFHHNGVYWIANRLAADRLIHPTLPDHFESRLPRELYDFSTNLVMDIVREVLSYDENDEDGEIHINSIQPATLDIIKSRVFQTSDLLMADVTHEVLQTFVQVHSKQCYSPADLDDELYGHLFENFFAREILA